MTRRDRATVGDGGVLMIWWRRLLWGCWWGGHETLIRERVKGRYRLRCDQCGFTKAFPRQRLKATRLNVVKGAFGQTRHAPDHRRA